MCLPLHRFNSKNERLAEHYTNEQTPKQQQERYTKSAFLLKYEITMCSLRQGEHYGICRSRHHTCVYIMWQRQQTAIVQDMSGSCQCL